MSVRISDLLGKAVVDVETGEKLGRAWDVRVRRENKGSVPGKEDWIVEGLVISRSGALERFGIIHLRTMRPSGSWRSGRDAVPWDAIETIGREVIKVRLPE